MNDLIKFPPGLILITVVQKLATGGIKIEPFLHLVGIDPGVVVEPHPILGIYFGIIIFFSGGTGGEEKLSRLARVICLRKIIHKSNGSDLSIFCSENLEVLLAEGFGMGKITVFIYCIF